MLLTCPNCSSGLQVPDGTTALVRCPACKTVFSPADGATPAAVEPAPAPDRPRRPRPDDEDEDDRPRRRKPARHEDDEDEGDKKSENRDFDPIDPDEKPRRKRRTYEDDDSLDPAERERIRRAFARAAWGCKLITLSFTLFLLSMVLILGLWFQAAFSEPSYGFILAAGVLGAANWLLAAVGVGLCLSGPPTPGHWGYGIAAAVATGVHLVLVMVLVGQGKEYSAGKVVDPNGPGVKWGLVPTRMDAFTFYLTFLLYREQDLIPKEQMNLSIVVGVFEVVRTMLILMLLSCLARAAGDEDLSGDCTRAAGVATFGPGILALLMLIFVTTMVETNASGGNLGKILFSTLQMGIYAILAGTLFPGFMAAREVTDACDEPFQSQIPKL